MKNTLFCLISALTLFSGLTAASQTDEADLLKAYRARSTAQLDSFFLRWQTAFPSIDETALAGASDTIRNIYGVFKAFYTPLEI